MAWEGSRRHDETRVRAERRLPMTGELGSEIAAEATGSKHVALLLAMAMFSR